MLASGRRVSHNPVQVRFTVLAGIPFMAMPDDPVEDIFHPGGRLRTDLLTDAAAAALRESLRLARETRWESLRSPHVFMGLLAVADPAVRNWGDRLRADLPRLLDQFRELFQQERADEVPHLAMTREFFSDNVLRLLRDAHTRACDHDRGRITPMDLLITLLTASNSIVAECFARRGVTAAKLTELAVIAEQQVGRT
jgi:ATP-dependent Clp protease ATP-binding subunit ClpA